MTDVIVGVIGASGSVGLETVKSLFEHTDYHLALGARNIDKMDDIFSWLGTRGTFFKVDIFNDEELKTFCINCNLIINCAGPSKKILDKISLASIKSNCHYVDVSGDSDLYTMLNKRVTDIKSKNLTHIISAGLYPGLTELLPAYIANNNFKKVDHMEVFLSSKGTLSINAAYDYICSIRDDYVTGMAYCHKGRIKKIQGSYRSKAQLPYFSKKLDVYPIISNEFQVMADQNNINSFYFYSVYQDKSLVNKLMNVKVMEKYKSEDEIRESAEMLCNELEKDNDIFTLIHVESRGYLEDKKILMKSSLMFQGDGNRLSGIIAANSAKTIIESNCSRYGCFYLQEGIDAKIFMKNLLDFNVIFSEEAFD